MNRGDKDLFGYRRWDGYRWVSEAEFHLLEQKARGDMPTIRCPARSPECPCGIHRADCEYHR